MALFKRENSDGSELSPFAVLLLLLLVGSIGFSLFNKFKGSSDDETRNMPELDKSSISAYERIDEEIDGLKQEDGFEGKSVKEKKKIIINRLTELQDEGLITQNSITYQEGNEMIWYEWGDGYVAGIMLSDFGDGLSGNADKNSFSITESISSIISNKVFSALTRSSLPLNRYSYLSFTLSYS